MILQRTIRSVVIALTAALVIGETGAVDELLDSVLDELVEEEIQQQVEADVIEALEQQIEADVIDALERSVEDTVEQALEADLDELVEDLTAAAPDARVLVDEIAPATTERYYPALDEHGRSIERGVWVIFVPPGQLAQIERQGFTVREQRPLDGLGLVLIRVEAPDDRMPSDAARRLSTAAPAARVDYNHLYRSDTAGAPQAPNDEKPSAAAARPPIASIGIVDSAIATGHEALRAADIVARDFVPFARPRPTDHGTAVASLLVGESDSLTGRLAGTRLHAASVFFEDEAGTSAATTTSLVRALDWLVVSGSRVVNMSLSGPPNRVLEAAIDGVRASGTIVVAAVGNDGPAAPPLYPAAYPTVVGVTAVDADDRVYRYANRGRQVTFAAFGVHSRVALADGGYGTHSGTSMAAPLAAAAIARSLAAGGESPDRVLAALKASAVDLGKAGYDETFGFGKIRAGD